MSRLPTEMATVLPSVPALVQTIATSIVWSMKPLALQAMAPTMLAGEPLATAQARAPHRYRRGRRCQPERGRQCGRRQVTTVLAVVQTTMPKIEMKGLYEL